MKNVTDFCKTVETGVDLHLPLSFVKQWRYHKKNSDIGNGSSLVALPYKTVLAMQWFRLKNQWFDGMCAMKSAPLGIHTETTPIVMGEGVELPRHALPFGCYDGTVLYCQ